MRWAQRAALVLASAGLVAGSLAAAEPAQAKDAGEVGTQRIATHMQNGGDPDKNTDFVILVYNKKDCGGDWEIVPKGEWMKKTMAIRSIYVPMGAVLRIDGFKKAAPTMEDGNICWDASGPSLAPFIVARISED